MPIGHERLYSWGIEVDMWIPCLRAANNNAESHVLTAHNSRRGRAKSKSDSRVDWTDIAQNQGD